MTASMRRPIFVASLVSTAIPLICVSCLDWAAVTSWGSEGLLWLQLLFVIPVLFIAVLIIPCLIGLLFPSTRRPASIGLLCSVAYILGLAVGAIAGNSVRMHAFRNLAHRSAPLVNAIHTYENKYGHPPDSLSALVPEFLTGIPSTGMRAYPKYEYALSSKEMDSQNDRWELYIETPSGGINWDRLVYWPSRDYPRYMYGGSVQKVGDWAYVHE